VAGLASNVAGLVAVLPANDTGGLDDASIATRINAVVAGAISHAEGVVVLFHF
jgi:hypothetical protein